MMSPQDYDGRETYHPLVLGNLVYTRGRRLFGFFLKVRNVPGVLAGISSVFAKFNVNILSVHFNPPGGGSAPGL